MNEENFKQLLRNPEQEPSDALLRTVLNGPIFEIMQAVEQSLVAAEIDLEWRYYKDGKSWLGKATHKKKTMVWISVWEHCIKVSFYFTEKTRPGVLELSINEEAKSLFSGTKLTGKLIPLILEVKDIASLKDLNTLLNYKKNLR